MSNLISSYYYILLFFFDFWSLNNFIYFETFHRLQSDRAEVKLHLLRCWEFLGTIKQTINSLNFWSIQFTIYSRSFHSYWFLTKQYDWIRTNCFCSPRIRMTISNDSYSIDKQIFFSRFVCFVLFSSEVGNKKKYIYIPNWFDIEIRIVFFVLVTKKKRLQRKKLVKDCETF